VAFSLKINFVSVTIDPPETASRYFTLMAQLLTAKDKFSFNQLYQMTMNLRE